MILLACAECLPVVQSADTLGSEESDGDSEPSSVESADEWSDAEDDGSGYERYTDTLDAELDAAFEQYSSLRAKESQSSQSAADGEEDLYAPVKSSDAAVARPAGEGGGTMTINWRFQEPTKRFSVNLRRSRDDGKTWGADEAIYLAAGGRCHAGAPQVTR